MHKKPEVPTVKQLEAEFKVLNPPVWEYLKHWFLELRNQGYDVFICYEWLYPWYQEMTTEKSDFDSFVNELSKHVDTLP